MFSTIIEKLLDRAQTQDFWRGVVYALAATGVSVSPENANQIVTIALAVSGVVHMVWHKTHAS